MAASSSRRKSRSSTATTKPKVDKGFRGLAKALTDMAGAAKAAQTAMATQVSDMQWMAVSMSLAGTPAKPEEAWTELLVTEGLLEGKAHMYRAGVPLTADLGYVDYSMLKVDKLLKVRSDKIPDQIVANALLAYGQHPRSDHYKPVAVVIDEKPKSYNVKVYFLISVSKYDDKST